MKLEEQIDEEIRETTPQHDAVLHLLKVSDRGKNKQSDVELKTDLSETDVRVHSVLAILNSVLEAGPAVFSQRCILGDLIEKKERKLLSKDRKSRIEVVEVARNPDQLMPQQGVSENFVRRLFTPRQRGGM